MESKTVSYYYYYYAECSCAKSTTKTYAIIATIIVVLVVNVVVTIVICKFHSKFRSGQVIALARGKELAYKEMDEKVGGVAAVDGNDQNMEVGEV